MQSPPPKTGPLSVPLERPGGTTQLRLATPSPNEVAAFARLYKERFGDELNPDDALLIATHYIHMFQILTYEPPVH